MAKMEIAIKSVLFNESVERLRFSLLNRAEIECFFKNPYLVMIKIEKGMCIH